MHTQNRSWFMLDADASPGFQPASRDGGMALVEGTAIIYWHQTGTTWNKIDLSTLAGADGILIMDKWNTGLIMVQLGC